MNNQIINFSKQAKRPLVLDGALGTYLIEKGIKPYRNLWTTVANISNWELVKNIHEEYISKGSEIITTNTFNSNPHSVISSNFDRTSQELVKLGVKAAFEARNDKAVLIAGSNAPAEDSYQKQRTISAKELEYNHKKHIELLWENNVDIIWNETQSHLDEITIICDFCELNKLPYSINLFFTNDLKILSGEDLSFVLNFITANYPNALIGFNCIHPKTYQSFQSSFTNNNYFGFYFNSAHSKINSENISSYISPLEYLVFVKPLVNSNTVFVGSCCGSNPNHTQEIRKYFDKDFHL